jgi:hypothetical protein
VTEQGRRDLRIEYTVESRKRNLSLRPPSVDLRQLFQRVRVFAERQQNVARAPVDDITTIADLKQIFFARRNAIEGGELNVGFEPRHRGGRGLKFNRRRLMWHGL